MKIVFSNLIIHNIILRKIKLLKAALLSIIVISFTFSQENNLTDPADSLNVNKEDKKPLLLDDVKYDLKKAKSFIDLTEYKNGFMCSLILPKGAIPKLSETANIIKNSLSKINISVNILD